jgi:hypothetical protein
MNTTQVRDWDGGQGIEVKDRSPIPAELVVKFKATTGPGSRTVTISTAATSPPGEQSPCRFRAHGDQLLGTGRGAPTTWFCGFRGRPMRCRCTWESLAGESTSGSQGDPFTGAPRGW